MPYIKQELKDKFKTIEIFLETIFPSNSGELNYLFTLIIDQYCKSSLRYSSINDAIGALEGAKLEFYRRVVAGYEDLKITENGDVYKTQAYTPMKRNKDEK